MQPKNPFIVTGYQSPEYFCDRENETEKIINYLENDWNLTLIAPRRIGKTGLIQHVFYKMKERDGNVKCFYIDIFPTSCIDDFVTMLAKAVLGQLDGLKKSVLKKMTSFFKSCRPVITSDEITGAPSITLDFINNEVESSLKEICDYLVLSGKRCYIAIDEFQQITEYPEKNMEALLRSYIQFMPNVHFIFSGSKRHIMDEMFISANRPLYQSTRILTIKEIDIVKYYEFANPFFDKINSALSKEVFDIIYNRFCGHTWFVQSILNQLYMMKVKTIDNETVSRAINTIIEEQTSSYERLFSLLTMNQRMILKAIAKERIVTSPTSSRFIERCHGMAVSSIGTALKSLIDNEYLYKDEKGIIVYDRFMALWLERL